MNVVWDDKNYLDVLGDCEDGAVVMLRKCPGSGPFLVTNLRNTVDFRYLFNLYNCTSEWISPDERVEVLETELHIL